jgi:hypothetical protein
MLSYSYNSKPPSKSVRHDVSPRPTILTAITNPYLVSGTRGRYEKYLGAGGKARDTTPLNNHSLEPFSCSDFTALCSQQKQAPPRPLRAAGTLACAGVRPSQPSPITSRLESTVSTRVPPRHPQHAISGQRLVPGMQRRIWGKMCVFFFSSVLYLLF